MSLVYDAIIHVIDSSVVWNFMMSDFATLDLISSKRTDLL